MKKLMIAVAVVAMTFGASAAKMAFGWQECENCGGTSSNDCFAVFKVTGSGKAVVSTVSKKGDDYKSVGKLTIKKGGLAMIGQVCAKTGQCCYESAAFFATIKAGKETFQIALSDVELAVWSVFGKNLEKAREYDTEIKPGKTVSLDSALFLKAEDAENEMLDPETISFYAAAFGKVNFKVEGKSSKYCKDTGCDPTITPKNYSGWFVGTYPCVGEENCFLCECADTDVFGGTWKAVFKAGLKKLDSAAKLGGITYIIED